MALCLADLTPPCRFTGILGDADSRGGRGHGDLLPAQAGRDAREGDNLLPFSGAGGNRGDGAALASLTGTVSVHRVKPSVCTDAVLCRVLRRATDLTKTPEM